ncbi:hypothetical protein SKAU_G00049400, partial [Synaphobranchus kaupii]
MCKCKCDCVVTFLTDNRRDVHRDPDDFIMFQRNQELLGVEAKDCGVSVSLECTGMENEARDSLGVTYVLYRCSRCMASSRSPNCCFMAGGRAWSPRHWPVTCGTHRKGLLVAAVVALDENSKVRLEEADVFFQELCRDGAEVQDGAGAEGGAEAGGGAGAQIGPQLLVDFWEALLVASSQDPIIQELLFRLTSVYIDRVAQSNQGVKPLKTAEDLVNSCCHYGTLFPWVSVLTPAQLNVTPGNQEDLEKLQVRLLY